MIASELLKFVIISSIYHYTYSRCMKVIVINRKWVLSWPKLDLEPKFHDPGTFGGIGKKMTNKQDSCFISIDVIDY